MQPVRSLALFAALFMVLTACAAPDVLPDGGQEAAAPPAEPTEIEYKEIVNIAPTEAPLTNSCIAGLEGEDVYMFPRIDTTEYPLNKAVRAGVECVVLDRIYGYDLLFDAYGPQDLIYVNCNNFKGYIFADWCK